MDHSDVKGVLRLATIPVDVLRVDKSKVPLGFAAGNNNDYIVSTNTTVMFVNRGEKKTPTEIAGELSSHKKVSILPYSIKEHADEP